MEYESVSYGFFDKAFFTFLGQGQRSWQLMKAHMQFPLCLYDHTKRVSVSYGFLNIC